VKPVVKQLATELYVTPEQEDLFVIGLPLKTKYGFIRPIKVKEYPKYIQWIEFLKFQDWEVKRIIRQQVKGTMYEETVKEDLENNTLFRCIQTNVFKLKDAYGEIFKELMPNDYSDDFFYKNVTSQVEFDELRRLILSFNRIEYREKNPNPEIERGFKMKEWLASKKGNVITFDSMYTSLCVNSKPHDINDYTLSQFYGSFKRLEMFKLYDTTTLYKTVDSKDKVKVVEWFKSFKDKPEEKSFEDVLGGSVKRADNLLKQLPSSKPEF
jgi:hypothetical protein